MIVTQLLNTNPYLKSHGMACKVLGESLPEVVPESVNDICICNYITCEYVEKVFADPTSSDFWKNDKNEFLFRRLVAVDTVAIKLFKDGVEVADLNDNTLGTFYNGFASGSAEQQKYVGFLVDWKLVEAAHGVGEYQIKADLSIIGNTSTYESRKFRLCIYSDLAANGTVRIESTQNGNIEGSDFDYTGLEWYQSFRIAGKFGNPTPVFEEDRYTTETRKIRQIKDKMGREWTLKTGKVNYEVGEKLIYNKMLANEILITDYSILAESIWRRQSVLPSSIEKPEIADSLEKIYVITFIDDKDIYIKRNF